MEESNGSALSRSQDNDPAQKPDENGPPLSPPYWQRGNSTLSILSSSRPKDLTSSKKNRLSGPIRLFDNSEEETSDQARACWAKSARIDDYVIVSGSVSKAGLGSYVVWNCTVETLNVSTNCLAHDTRSPLYMLISCDLINNCGADSCMDRVDHSRYGNAIRNLTS